jgi:hypothetical protein
LAEGLSELDVVRHEALAEAMRIDQYLQRSVNQPKPTAGRAGRER